MNGLCIVRVGALAALLAIGAGAAAASPEAPASLPRPALLNNLVQLRRCAEQRSSVVHPFRIVADVLDVDSASGVLVLRDPSGVEFIKLDLRNHTIEPGATVCLEGTGCAFKPKRFGLVVVPSLVVDNDGLHGIRVESGTVFLEAGLNPITVQWFNGIGDFSLSAEYDGPGLQRQSIPAAVFSRANVNSATGLTNFSPGLDYRCYEGDWEFLPDFARLQPSKTGVATNFDLSVRTRDEHVGLQFNGFIKIPRDGVYTFYVGSDDGSRLFVGQPSLDVGVLSNGPAPVAVEKVPSTAREERSQPWVTLEGTVEFAGIWAAGGELQMRVGHDDIRVEIFEGGDVVPNFPPGANVRVSGIYQNLVTEDGSQVPGMLLVSSWKAIHPVRPSKTRLAQTISGGETAGHLTLETMSATNSAAPALTTVAGRTSRRSRLNVPSSSFRSPSAAL